MGAGSQITELRAGHFNGVSFSVAGDGFVEATDNDTLLAIAAAQPAGQHGSPSVNRNIESIDNCVMRHHRSHESVILAAGASVSVAARRDAPGVRDGALHPRAQTSSCRAAYRRT